jgi:hypothetical protein
MFQNLIKLEAKVVKKKCEVEEFLDSIGLIKYWDLFKQNGFDEMEILSEIQTKHLVDMKIPSGHQIKIIKRIQVLRHEDPETLASNLANNTKLNALPQEKVAENAATRSSSATGSQRHIKFVDPAQEKQERPETALQSGEEKKENHIKEKGAGSILKNSANTPTSKKSIKFHDPSGTTSEGTGMSPRYIDYP